jgi:xanthine dehydrogenase accessory factor
MLLVVQIGGERLHRTIVDLHLAVRVSARCEQQQRAASRGIELGVVELDRLARHVREHRQRVAELAAVDAREQVVEDVHFPTIIPVDDVLVKAEEWRSAGEDVALATVVATRRSAPRPLGSKLAVTSSGRLYGSVSGGCVEADVAERAQAVLAGEPPTVVSYGIEDDVAWGVGLPCGGEIDVFIERFAGAPRIERGTSYVVVAGGRAGERWHDDVRTGTRLDGDVFAEAIAPPLRLVAVGAGDIAEALCAIAKPLGWRTVVLEPRPGLATRERVPSADELVVAWPDDIAIDEDTAVVSLVHEERLDLPALRAGIERGAFYVGALGSKRAQEKRRQALGGLLDRVHGPVGLDLGGETPAEIALEIVAQILVTRKRGATTR